MATFNDLYDYTMPYLPGAEPGIIDFHIRRALREFFKRTSVWREVIEFTTTPGEATYQLQPTAGVVAAVMSVHIDGHWRAAIPENKRDPYIAAGLPTAWYSLLPQVITLYPQPAGTTGIRVEAALTLPLDDTARSFPDSVLEEHAEAIAAGVISAMMLMPGKPWTQREAGAMYGRIFGSAIRDTRGKLRDGGQPNQSTFHGPRFGV